MSPIYQVLHRLHIEYARFDHPPVFTCAEANKYWVNSQAAHTKNLFLKTEKTPHRYFLYILECSRKADLKSLTRQLNQSRLTFANPEELQTILNLTPGSVSPFGLINDHKHQVIVLIDRMLNDKYENLLFHPNTNTATVEISWTDFKKFLSHTGHPYQIVDLP